MKKFFLVSIGALLAAHAASAAAISSGRYNASKDALELDVVYGGGCKEHQFKIKIRGCLESLPVQCTADLVDLTRDDFCEAIVGTKVLISMKDAGLDSSYYSQASLTIQGDRPFGNGSDERTSATIRLPQIP